MTEPIAVHATALLVGEAGVLIRGPSGSGKSGLALRLLDLAAERGRFARLVSDDRVLLRCCSGLVLASPHEAIVGLLERRTQPIARLPAEPCCVVRLVVELHTPANPLPRWTDDAAETTTLAGQAGVPLLRLQGPIDALSCQHVLDRIETLKSAVRL
ncbi:hypothetical protein P7D22_02775 [Lichenihabitans sp. Uapishka_5]|uniref:HPr kinase/phosphorylase n=1 Tax=Lichenihabitans sp. Uapishka_5 TaxID=3037302 RepID=UPI0029E82404|nr:hypothetical protein [Lichenihabitans sp. Uapishka_5]MDX7950100.1 hypothetical protein [Lichenihabitans sp. Uapishka_5]